MDSYGTHFPILAAAISRSKGAILELGCGDYSTPLIHYAAAHRYVLSADTDRAWITKFAEGYACPRRHEFQHVEDWKRFSIPPIDFGVAFIDCAPGEARHELAVRVAHRAQWVILHDSETDYGSGGNYMYDRAKPHFKYVTEFRRFRPYTLIMSNVAGFPIETVDQQGKPPTQ